MKKNNKKVKVVKSNKKPIKLNSSQQKQLDNKEVDVLSGKRFDDPDDNKNMDFSNIMSIDTNMLQSAFDIHIDEAEMRAISEKYMTEINNAIVIDTEPAHQAVINNLKVLSNGVFNSVPDGFEQEEINTIVDNYLESYEPGQIFSELESTYMVPKDVYKTLYSGLLIPEQFFEYKNSFNLLFAKLIIVVLSKVFIKRPI